MRPRSATALAIARSQATRTLMAASLSRIIEQAITKLPRSRTGGSSERQRVGLLGCRVRVLRRPGEYRKFPVRAAPPRRVPPAHVLRGLGELVSSHTDSKTARFSSSARRLRLCITWTAPETDAWKGWMARAAGATPRRIGLDCTRHGLSRRRGRPARAVRRAPTAPLTW
jgi:hypothetical protein